MKRSVLGILLVGAVLAGLLAGCGSPRKTASADTGYDVYLLIGQSNMAGRGKMLPQDTLKAIEGVWLLGPDDKPVPAKNPLNQYSTIRKDIKMQQICPGTAFSQTMRAKRDRDILIVMNARGGTTLDQWVEGTEYYSEAVRRTLEGMKYGTLRGILWHQGCGDSSPAKVAVYMDKLSGMVAALRRDLGVGNSVPFIAGELAYWRKSSAGFNEMIHGISSKIPNSSWVSAEGCTWLKGEKDPHFGRDGQLLLGQRYAEEMLKFYKKKKK